MEFSLEADYRPKFKKVPVCGNNPRGLQKKLIDDVDWKPRQKSIFFDQEQAEFSGVKQVSLERVEMNSYEAKKQARIDRLRDRAAAVAGEAESRLKTARSMASAIPFGQPILINHHSEKRDRNYRGRIENNFRKGFEAMEAAKDLEYRAEAAENNNAISSDDPEAVVKLKEKLAEMEVQREGYKALNAAHKKFLKDPASLENSGLSDGQKEIVRNYKPQYSWEPHPIPPYRLQNLGGNIRRVEDRIKSLEYKQEQPAAKPVEGAGWKLVENVEENRVQFIFPGKPASEVRDVLKSHGFRWAPSQGAWQRQLNGNGRYAAKMVAEKLAGKAVPNG